MSNVTHIIVLVSLALTVGWCIGAISMAEYQRRGVFRQEEE